MFHEMTDIKRHLLIIKTLLSLVPILIHITLDVVLVIPINRIPLVPFYLAVYGWFFLLKESVESLLEA